MIYSQFFMQQFEGRWIFDGFFLKDSFVTQFMLAGGKEGWGYGEKDLWKVSSYGVSLSRRWSTLWWRESYGRRRVKCSMRWCCICIPVTSGQLYLTLRGFFFHPETHRTFKICRSAFNKMTSSCDVTPLWRINVAPRTRGTFWSKPMTFKKIPLQIKKKLEHMFDLLWRISQLVLHMNTGSSGRLEL